MKECDEATRGWCERAYQTGLREGVAKERRRVRSAVAKLDDDFEAMHVGLIDNKQLAIDYIEWPLRLRDDVKAATRAPRKGRK